MILDVMMPKMDGWQVCREVRQTSGIPIIMLTARSEERDELQGFELGVDEDCPDIIALLPQLAPQFFHMCVDRPGISKIIIIPHIVQDLLPGQRDPLVLDKIR